MKNKITLLFLIANLKGFSQTDERLSTSYNKKYSYGDYIGYFNGIKATNIGPTIMSGRVTDIEVDPNDATHFYAAFATGGLWETKNNGTTFSQIFHDNHVFGIGDIAVDWKNNKIFVGTGECNSSRSSYAGTGLYVSSDDGKNWSHLGLTETQHISRVLINPNNSNEIYVAAIGHLFTYNKERGVYKTEDGGKTWNQILFINEKTGVIDLTFDPQNSKTLYACAWQRERTGWNFEESGEASGIYKTVDGGNKWEVVSTANSGFPQGKGVGRIGLAVSYQDSNVLYAFLDNQDHREKKNEEESDALTKDDFKVMSKEQFAKLNNEKLETYLRDNEFPEKYTAPVVKDMISSEKIQPVALSEYLEDANSMMFDTPVKGAELYRSNDGGKTWKKTHEGYLDNMVFTYGYYFGQIRVHPKNHDRVYMVAFFVVKSDDGGKTFTNINGDNVHVDHHSLYIDPNKEGHLINGNDGGINISYDNGINWTKCVNPEVGQFYTVAVDNAENYKVYGGLQDNGVWCGPHSYSNNAGWIMDGKYPYENILGGDGMQVQIDLRDNATIYTGWQYGSYFRINRNTGENVSITPKHELGERPLRFNWQTPIHLSVHQNDVIYLGANKLYRSLNKGNDFLCISPDLTTGGKKGDVAYSTLTAIHESPLKFGLVYTGSDDGLVYVTKDGGTNWENISEGLPKNYWIRRVVASRYNEARVYVCLSGHTMDDFKPLLFVSDNYGKNWKQIGNTLPYFPVNVLKEDAKAKNIVYAGTDNGLYVSIDGGEEFFPITNNFPTVPVHDMAIQERDEELVAATHGRSLYKINLKQIRMLSDSVRNTDFYVLPISKIKPSSYWGEEKKWYENDEHVPLVHFYYYSKKPMPVIELTIKDGDAIIYNEKVSGMLGLQSLSYNLQIESAVAKKLNDEIKKKNKGKKESELKLFEEKPNGKYYLIEGKYKVILTVEGKKYERVLKISKEKDK